MYDTNQIYRKKKKRFTHDVFSQVFISRWSLHLQSMKQQTEVKLFLILLKEILFFRVLPIISRIQQIYTI